MKQMFTISVVSLLLVGSVFAASAFTDAELTREAEVQVEGDESGIITLSPGENVDAVETDENGVLTIDAAPQEEVGLNVDGEFTFGDAETVNEGDEAFSITNADVDTRELTLSYEDVDEGVPSEAVEFELYDEAGEQVDTVSIDSQSSVNLDSGETRFVVMSTDTTELSAEDDLSGNLVITA